MVQMQKTVICVNEDGALHFTSAMMVAINNSLMMTAGNKIIEIPLESIAKDLNWYADRMKECTDG